MDNHKHESLKPNNPAHKLNLLCMLNSLPKRLGGFSNQAFAQLEIELLFSCNTQMRSLYIPVEKSYRLMISIISLCDPRECLGHYAM